MSIESDAPWIDVTPSPAQGLAWRVTNIHHLEPDANKGKHNVFVMCLINGVAVRNGSLIIRWGWEGQRGDEYAKPAVCDKQDAGYCADIPIEKGQRIWCEVADKMGYASERASNLHAVLPSNGEGNDWHHHSYLLTFELAKADVVTPIIDNPPTIPLSGTLTMEERMQRVERKLGLL